MVKYANPVYLDGADYQKTNIFGNEPLLLWKPFREGESLDGETRFRVRSTSSAVDPLEAPKKAESTAQVYSGFLFTYFSKA